MSAAQVHPRGLCESPHVGEGTRVWAFAHVLPGARIGRDCNICDHVFVENDVVLGDRVTVKSGVQLWDGLRLGDDVFIGPNATFSNDKFPRSKAYLASFPVTEVANGASIGANATILPGIAIGRSAMIGAGAVVTRDVPPFAIVAGNPARIIGYADAPRPTSTERRRFPAADEPPLETSVCGVRLHRLHVAEDLRGKLSVGNFAADVPFTPARYFVVYDVPSRDVRGEHAHRICRQFLVCVRGTVRVVVDDGRSREEVELSEPSLGVFVPPLVWSSQYRYSADAVLLVFASELYDPADYVRDYDEFLGLVGRA